MEVHSLIRDYKSLFIYTHLLWHCHIAAAVDPVCCGVYLTLPSSFHMEWCIKNDKIEILTMKYTWNGMECSWNVHGMCMECAWSVPYGVHGFHTLFHSFHGLHGLHMEWCTNYYKVELIKTLYYPKNSL